MGLSVTLGRWLGMVVMLVTLGPTLPPVCSLASSLACSLISLCSLARFKLFPLFAERFVPARVFKFH